MSNYSTELEKYKGPSSRHKCPNCLHNRELARYVYIETGEHVADHVGRCNRESSCGYHYKPSEWVKDGGNLKSAPISSGNRPNSEPEPISYIPSDFLEASLKGAKKANLAKYLISLFGERTALWVLLIYFVGRSRTDNGSASIFWQVDQDDNVRAGKVVVYDPVTGKRSKDRAPYQVQGLLNRKRTDDGLKPLRYEQTFFGTHLLRAYPDKPVGIVESEKTALIASVLLPDILWIATGGSNGCKWAQYEVFKVLANRTVIFYPDYGYMAKPTGKPESEWITCFQKWSERVERIAAVLPGTFTVSRVLEDHFDGKPRGGEDIADLIVNRDETGLAITEAINAEAPGYPVTWDLPANFHS